MSAKLCVLAVFLLAAVVYANTDKRSYLRQACTASDFKCKSGSTPCIEEGWVCDTEDDCDDASDEVGCPTDCTHPNQLKCNNGKCITRFYQCDGDDDCGDKTDETNCPSG